jgi:SH3-like domain-containing protein
VSGSDVSATPSPAPEFDPYAAGSVLYVKTGNGGKLNLRAKADASAITVNRYENGTQVTVLKHAGEWLYISTGSRTGYMMKQYLSASAPDTGSAPTPTPEVTWTPDTLATPAPAPEATPLPTSALESFAPGSILYVSTGNDGKLNLRSRASATAATINRYENGTPVTVLKEYGDWLKVRVDGRTGYMLRKYLSATQGTQ